MFSLNLKSNGDNNKMTKDCWSRLETVRKNLGFASKDEKWVELVKYYKSGPDLKNKILRFRKRCYYYSSLENIDTTRWRVKKNRTFLVIDINWRISSWRSSKVNLVDKFNSSLRGEMVFLLPEASKTISLDWCACHSSITNVLEHWHVVLGVTCIQVLTGTLSALVAQEHSRGLWSSLSGFDNSGKVNQSYVPKHKYTE